MKRTLSFIIAMSLVCSFFMLPAHADEVDSHAYSDSIDVRYISNDPDVTISDVMTYDEMVHHYAQEAGIPYTEAVKVFTKPYDTYAARAATYRTFTVTLNVKDNYKPHLEFYCETAEGGNFFNINSIYSVQLVRSYGSVSKQFSGDIDVWLRSTQSIEYTVNGDFYNYGNTTASGGAGLELGIGQKTKISFSISGSHTFDHYAYFYKHDTVTYGH